jgi:SPP1 family predicted phage head-tail adaptor
MELRRAGVYRTRVDLEKVTGRAPVADGYENTWAPYATVWAKVMPIVGSDRVVADTQQVPITHIVRLDYRADLKAEHRLRLVENDRRLYIRSLTDDEEKHWTWVLNCEERVM